MRTASARTMLSEQSGFQLAGGCSLHLLCRGIRIKHQQNHNPKFSGTKWKVKTTFSNSTLSASTASQVRAQLHTHTHFEFRLPSKASQEQTPRPRCLLPRSCHHPPQCGCWGKGEEASPYGGLSQGTLCFSQAAQVCSRHCLPHAQCHHCFLPCREQLADMHPHRGLAPALQTAPSKSCWLFLFPFRFINKKIPVE